MYLGVACRWPHGLKEVVVEDMELRQDQSTVQVENKRDGAGMSWRRPQANTKSCPRAQFWLASASLKRVGQSADRASKGMVSFQIWIDLDVGKAFQR